jgi:hypothetical protein
LAARAGALSQDGQVAAFCSAATNLVPGDNGVGHIFAHDLATGTTTQVSLASDGSQGNALSAGESISGDGRFVVFTSLATNLVANDTNGVSDRNLGGHGVSIRNEVDNHRLSSLSISVQPMDWNQIQPVAPTV